MRYDNRTAQVMKRAARGPAAIALRQQRILRPTQTGVNPAAGVIQGNLAGPARMKNGSRAGALLVGAGVGSNSMGASRLVSAGIDSGPLALRGLFARQASWKLTRDGRLGALGIAASTEQYGKAAGETAATATVTGAIVGTSATATTAATGLTAALQAAGYGSLVGPVGAVVGLIVGIAISEILKKNYLNVPQINQLQDAQVRIFDQYKKIQGRVPGRALGFDIMKALWKGAQNRGYFGTHGAGVKQCFHEGCFKYPGRGDWIDSDYSNNGASWQWGGVYQRWLSGRRAGGVAVQANLAPRSVTVAPRAYQIRQAASLRGLGSFGAVSTVSDAVSFVDNYFIPANVGRWAYPSNTFEHNMLYDLADAFLANQPGISTTPYVGIPNAEYGAPPAPATIPAPGQVVPPASSTQVTTSYPGFSYIGPDGSGRGLYLMNSDGAKINQNIPIYTPVGGVMTPTGQTFYNAASVPAGPNVQPAPQPGNTYPMVPVQTPSGTTVYQPNPNAPQAAAPASAPGINWGAILAIGAGAFTFFR